MSPQATPRSAKANPNPSSASHQEEPKPYTFQQRQQQRTNGNTNGNASKQQQQQQPQKSSDPKYKSGESDDPGLPFDMSTDMLRSLLRQFGVRILTTPYTRTVVYLRFSFLETNTDIVLQLFLSCDLTGSSY